ncbi:unnamed protein product [Caenorhabditis angaria]|uniref:Uncharacterized protein n=1 Tax=Caenorhabditis angaria TaxID=860376 RepID=A0A9P1IHI7_9PELO|nr:unnamed protein product [Caenorhabditis angaria]
MECSPWLVTLSRAISLFLWALGAISHIFALIVVIRIFKNYHPFFIIFYLLMILTRILSASVKTYGYIYILVFSKNSNVPDYVTDLLWIAKFSTQSAALGCIFERGYATYYAKSYENSKKRGIVLVLIGVTIFVTGFEFINNGSNDVGRKITTVTYGFIMTLFTVILIICNRVLMIKSHAKTKLSERYQLVENVKALRLLLPFIMAISINAIFLSAAIILFNVDTVFNLSQCQNFHYYIPVFYLILLQTTSLNFVAPLLICLRYKYCFGFGCERDFEKKEEGQIRNILSVKIADNTKSQNEEYFKQYKNQWEKQ